MSVFLSDLDDFITPSQACVNPFVLKKTTTTTSSSTKSSAKKITLANDFSSTEFDRIDASLPKPNLIKTKNGLANQKVATVSLNDCLACSGCVTSAETVLIQEQSNDKLLEKLRAPEFTVVICISPQSLASFATFLDMSCAESFLRIASVMKSLGVKYVLDTSAAGDVALLEAREEFMFRYRNGRGNEWIKPSATIAASATAVYQVEDSISGAALHAVSSYQSHPSTSTSSSVLTISGKNNVSLTSSTALPSVPVVIGPVSRESSSSSSVNAAYQLPMLASQCPGWVCYAEKTQPQAIPYISTTKSAQQILGVLLKRVLLLSICATGSTGSADDMETDTIADADGIVAEEVRGGAGTGGAGGSSLYIVSIQPCFDKKLEGSRKDFFHEDIEAQEVDLVLSTTEFWNLLEQQATATSATTAAAATSAAVAQQFAISSNDGKNNDEDHDVNDKKTGMPDNEEKEKKDKDKDTDTDTSLTVSQYLRSVSPDSPHGCDAIESLFRRYTADGRSLMSSSSSNAGSGGYLEHIFRYAALQILGVNLWGEPLVYTPGRNTDIAILDIEKQDAYIRTHGATTEDGNTTSKVSISSSSSDKLVFAKAYGFRNIQSVLLKQKSGKNEYDFVEIMACPSGCLNGGGQLKKASAAGNTSSSSSIAGSASSIRETPVETRERVAAADALFHDAATPLRRSEDIPLVRYLYPCISAAAGDSSKGSSSLLQRPFSEKAAALLHTRYHTVPKLEIVAPLATKW